MVVLLGLLIVLFLATLALGYKVCLMGSKEQGVLRLVGIIIGIVIMISSIIGGICTTVYLHKTLPKMGMMGMPPSRPGASYSRPQRPAQPGMGMQPGMNTPPAQPQAPRPKSEEKK